MRRDMTERSILVDGIYFGEGPRWRDGHLWLSDFYAHEVLKVDEAGNRSHVGGAGTAGGSATAAMLRGYRNSPRVSGGCLTARCSSSQ